MAGAASRGAFEWEARASAGAGASSSRADVDVPPALVDRLVDVTALSADDATALLRRCGLDVDAALRAFLDDAVASAHGDALAAQGSLRALETTAGGLASSHAKYVSNGVRKLERWKEQARFLEVRCGTPRGGQLSSARSCRREATRRDAVC